MTDRVPAHGHLRRARRRAGRGTRRRVGARDPAAGPTTSSADVVCHVLDGRRRGAPSRGAASAPASTSSSSTPATTSPRRSARATRSPRRCPSPSARSRRDQTRGRAGRQLRHRGCTNATPISAAHCARSPRCAARSRTPRLGVRAAPRREHVTRRTSAVVEWDARRSMVKLNPIAAWTQHDVDAYIAEQRRPREPAAVRRVRIDRLRPVHAADQARRGPARGTVGRHCPRPSAEFTTDRSIGSAHASELHRGGRGARGAGCGGTRPHAARGRDRLRRRPPRSSGSRSARSRTRWCSRRPTTNRYS